MKNYDEINPEEYQKMYEVVPREIYMKTHWRPLIEEVIKKYCKDKNVLDLGCGYGMYTGIINKNSKNVIGLDISKRWLDYARQEYPDVQFILADVHKIPLRNESLSAIVAIGLFEYIDRDVVIKEIRRVLETNGIFIISVPNKYSAYRLVGKLINKIFRIKNYTKEPSKREILKLFVENQFRLVEYKMDDGLIWLPGFLDKFIGIRIYRLIEWFFKFFANNPFSNIMLFVVKKY